jgi:hypothetical protein
VAREEKPKEKKRQKEKRKGQSRGRLTRFTRLMCWSCQDKQEFLFSKKETTFEKIFQPIC